jgi:hypothetical protein
MKTVLEDKTTIEFRNPDVFSEPILVKRLMPDNSEETIGRIYQSWSNDDVSITYECINAEGDEICPATSDWIQAENAFVKYAKHNHSKSLTEQSIEKGDVYTWYEGRETEVMGIRENRGRKNRNIEISK